MATKRRGPLVTLAIAAVLIGVGAKFHAQIIEKVKTWPVVGGLFS